MKNLQTKYKLNFKTMKKGLLTLLAASLVFVGCQNYDDQFDDLNAQISALKSQVDGLSSLSGQVSSLSGTISGLQAGVNAAQAAASAASSAASAIDLSGLSASLATLQAEVDAVQASLATAATASAVAALQAEIDAIEADVDELLSTSNIYSTDVTVNSASTLDAALALGNKINILNATATITVSTAMDQTKVQTLVDRLLTVTGNIVFNSSSTTETTFNNLTSAEDITMNQKGGYQMKALTSAANITLNDQYEANISVIDLRALATVTTITTSGESDAGIQFDQATEVHLSKLTRYPGSQLTIITKKGATLDMPLLDDLNTLGVYEETNLTLNGPAAYTSSLMQDSDQSYTNVASVTVSGNIGDITINAGVETLSLTDAVNVTVSTAADDLVTATIDMAADSDSTLTTAQTAALRYDDDGFTATNTGTTTGQGDLDLTTLANLKTLTISGVAGDMNIDQNPNLESVTITADAMDLYLVDNDNMTSVDVTGAKLGSVEVSGNADLASLTLDHTTALRSSSSTAAEKSVTVNVNTNASLTSLTAGMDDVSGLLVYTNANLATVDFTGLTDDGTEATAYAHIFNNNLTFDLVKDGYDTGTTYTLTDTGSTTGGGGIKTLKTWLQHVDGAVNATYGLYVFVDAISKYEVQSTLNGTYTDTAVPSAPTVTTQAQAFSNRTSLYAVTALEAAETSATVAAVNEKMTYVTSRGHNGANAKATDLGAGAAIFINVNGVSKTFGTNQSNGGTAYTTIAGMVAHMNGNTSFGSDITVAASEAGFKRSVQTINYTQGDGSAGAVSARTGGTNTLWFKLGSTAVSGALGLANGDTAAAIAAKLAAAIEASNQSATNGGSNQYLYNAKSNGAEVEIYKALSVAGYPNDIRTSVSDIPTITFVIDAAGTSTTASLDAGATSNSASLNQTGSTSGFFLSASNENIPGVAVTLTNSYQGAARFGTLASAVTDNFVTTSGTSALGIVGAVGSTSATGANPWRATSSATFSDYLVSGETFTGTAGGSNSDPAVVFANISASSGGSTTQVAAITNRSGWL